MIVSESNKQIKYIEKLIKNSRQRIKDLCYVVEGEKMVFEAIRTGNAKKIYFSSDYQGKIISMETDKEEVKVSILCENNENGAPNTIAQNMEAEVVDETLFRKISDTSTPQGVMALVGFDIKTMKDLKSGSGHFLGLEDLRDPGNMGTIIRSAEAAGMDGIILGKGCCDIYSPKVTRSAMGSLFRVPVFHCENLIEDMKKLRENEKFKIYGTGMEGAVKFSSCEYSDKCVVIIGNEANGMSKECMEICDRIVYIPMAGMVESLNAGVAASLIMYEMNRKNND